VQEARNRAIVEIRKLCSGICQSRKRAGQYPDPILRITEDQSLSDEQVKKKLEQLQTQQIWKRQEEASAVKRAKSAKRARSNKREEGKRSKARLGGKRSPHIKQAPPSPGGVIRAARDADPIPLPSTQAPHSITSPTIGAPRLQ